MTGQSEEASLQLEHITASDLYPKKSTMSDDKSLQVPYPTLPGESVLYLGRTSEGTIALSNFRLFIRFKDSFINVPLGMVESVECRDIFYLHLYCKDSRTFRCTFPTNDSCIEWFKRILKVMMPSSKLDEHFAFAYHAWCRDSLPRDIDIDLSQELIQSDKYSRYLFDREVERMGFQLGIAWKITHINENYDFSPTYPPYHLLPASFQDVELQNVANFRTAKRFPSVVWRSQNTGGVIARCSQPEVGWLGWRNEFDEAMIKAIYNSAAFFNSQVPSGDSLAKLEAIGDGQLVENGNGNFCQATKMLIVDCRSYAAAWANRAKGGGCECAEYYENCEVQFMGLANIHAVRKSFQAVRVLCAGSTVDQASWFSALETTKWLHHISAVLKASVAVVNAVDCEGCPVLVHCSDGWDRTSQIVSLAELMLDPYYRTMQGFQVLVEREWLEFGHKFADRCGNGVCSDDLNERSPVFLQWLDCVHQLVKQFPCAFEFNEAFLVKLVQHTYSCLYGTFLCNSSMERYAQKVRERTSSVWSLLKPGKFHNFLYSTAGSQILRPSCQLRHLTFWSSVYLNSTTPTAAGLEDAHDPEDVSTLIQPELKKTKSCDDIVAALEHTSNMTRRLSDPNISMDVHHDNNSSLKQHVVQNVDDNAAFDNRITMNVPDTVSFVNTASETTLVNGSESYTSEIKDGPGEDKPTTAETVNCDTEVLTNGHLTDKEEGEVSAENGENLEHSRKDSATIVTTLDGFTQSHLSSTDTLTEDLALLELRNNNGHQPLVNGVHAESGDSDTVCKGHRLADYNKVASISTSTSDISDSHVKINLRQSNGHSRLDETLMNLNVVSGLRTFTNGCSQGHSDLQLFNPSSKLSMSSTDTENSTPSYYRTPGSTCPPTPGTDNRTSDPWLSRGTNGLGKHLDVDGLTTFSDPAQMRLLQMDREYRSRIESLERQLQAAKLALYQYASGCNGAGKHLDNRDDVISLPDEDTEQQSQGNGSTAASDLSWEQVEEKEANMTLWVPDHVVTHCAGCDCEFWIVRRKHHCRNCGQVFCSECTKFSIPVPQQQLNNPVRVCRRCFNCIDSDDQKAELLVSEEVTNPVLSVEVI